MTTNLSLELRNRKMKPSKSEDEHDNVEETPMIILLGEDEEESLLAESARDHEITKDLVNVINQINTTEDNPAGLNDVKIYLLVLCALLQTAVFLLAMHLFSDRHARDEIYEARHVTFLADVTKFVVACYLEYMATQGNLLASLRVFVKERPKDALLMLIPALLFETHDWLSRIAVDNLQPHPFRFFQEMRILATAVMSMRILKTSYTSKQWICMLLVFVGMFTSTIDHALSKSFWNYENANMVLGYETVILSVVCFAVGSVYFEHVIKVVPEEEGDVPPSLWMRLVQLSFFTMIIHGIRGGLVSAPGESYFHGFGPLVWLLVLTQAASGLAVSATIYFTDNILKCLAVAAGSSVAAMFFALSWDFGSSGLAFFLGFAMVASGVWFYCKPLPAACRRQSR